MLEYNLYEGWKSIFFEIYVYFVVDIQNFKNIKRFIDIVVLKMIVNLIWMSIRQICNVYFYVEDKLF